MHWEREREKQSSYLYRYILVIYTIDYLSNWKISSKNQLILFIIRYIIKLNSNEINKSEFLVSIIFGLVSINAHVPNHSPGCTT